MATVQAPAEQRLLLSGIDWPAYQTFGDLLEESHVRLTYDRGELEFRTVSSKHERAKHLLGLLLAVLSLEIDIDIAGFGSMTFRREDLARGLEPDECYWIANESFVRGRDEIDLSVDPPPDVVIEVEISRSVLDRIALYAALRVPEVWRYDGEVLRFCRLNADGRYEEEDVSGAFPFLSPAVLPHFMALVPDMGETKLLRTFQFWVRDQMARGWPSPPDLPPLPVQ